MPSTSRNRLLLFGQKKPVPTLPSSLVSLTKFWVSNNPSTISLNTNNVTQWNDQSGNNRNVANPTGSSQPTFANNEVVFDGVNDFLDTVNLVPNTEATGYCYFLVVKVNIDINSSNYALNNGNGANATGYGYYTTSSSQRFYINGGHNLAQFGTAPIGIYEIICVNYLVRTVSCYVNSNQITTVTNRGFNNPVGKLSLGQLSSATDSLGCAMKEVIIFDGLTQPQIDQVFIYLNSKHSVY